MYDWNDMRVGSGDHMDRLVCLMTLWRLYEMGGIFKENKAVALCHVLC